MNLSDQRARDILGHLINLLQEGWEALLLAKRINEARTSNRIKSTYYFFNITERSCIEAALLALSKIIIPYEDSINIQYLLNYVEQNSQVFSRADRKTIVNNINKHRLQLETISSLIANIKEERDHTLAHLDKKHITNPSSLHKYPPLNYLEVENTFELILNMINTYFGYLVPSNDFRLHAVDSPITNDCNYLVELMERDNTKPRIKAG